MSRRLIDGQLPARNPNAKPGSKPEIKLTTEIIEEIVKPLTIGLPPIPAAALRGVSYDVLRKWVIRGHKEPESLFGVLVRRIQESVALFQLRDVSVIERHSTGAPAEYLMEPLVDIKGKPVYEKDENGKKKPVMRIARDKEGNPIIRRQEIKSDWRAAAEMLSRRMPRTWGRSSEFDHDAVLTFTDKEPETKEAMTFKEEIAKAIRELEEEV